MWIDTLVNGGVSSPSTLDECPSLDENGDGVVTVNELVMAVNNVLGGIAPP
jgi:hypothetical protein